MMENTTLKEDLDYSWAQDKPRKKISTPYNFKEKVCWLKNNIFGPLKKFNDLITFLPQKIQLNDIKPEIKLGFIGDVMKMGKRELEFSDELKNFFNDIDYLIMNFEGTISDGKKVFMAQKHDERIISFLKALFPPKNTILGCSNNHSGDFGWTEFNKSYNMLKEHGFIVMGRRDEPSIMLKHKINLVNLTRWSNQPCEYISKFDCIESYINPEANFKILYPHWGFEMQLYPNSKQIEGTKSLLNDWDLIVGHHSHCPQPITAYKIRENLKLVAYSLGNFCFDSKFQKYRHGMVLNAEIGPDQDGKWKVGKVHWKFSFIDHLDKNITEIQISDSCKYFKNIEFIDSSKI
ncbi:MAG: hypothetical protein GF329_11960 [Candidatus Lokiarchaeota archaeon]|nr:hypothetical protein [Candidatus Lokiarchaeota archaeon]